MKIKLNKYFKSGKKKKLYKTGDKEFPNMKWYYSNKVDAVSKAKKLRKQGDRVRVWDHILYKVKGKGQKEYVLYRRKK